MFSAAAAAARVPHARRGVAVALYGGARGVIVVGVRSAASFFDRLRGKTQPAAPADEGGAPASVGESPLFADVATRVAVDDAVPAQAGADSGVKRTQVTLKRLQISPTKLNPVAKLVRGMSVREAMLQSSLSIKKGALFVNKAVRLARAHAENTLGFDGDRLVVEQAWVGKGNYIVRARFHARGRFGMEHKPYSRLTVVVREVPRTDSDASETHERRLGKSGWLNETWSRATLEPERVHTAKAYPRPEQEARKQRNLLKGRR